ncbi:E3 ubiquitin-protein ligase Midline-1-like [Lytechinus variegatus]|uniref:E3 ubiquitin-protein ligase Midline-1-like n=1 Tax=Lytechinus variegatus TaxID=7654 RepID=UPI001BB20B4D|nr:E3 ubiquitin-protein ligase Midline-1-like [Lytechinus variegatus]
MAERNQGSGDSYTKGLTCPMCLDIFKDATLLTGCGHSFCRRCLKRYDMANYQLNHIVCPVCRKLTPWKRKRVDALSSNHALNDFIYGLYGKSGGPSRRPQQRTVKCDTCELEVLAKYLCRNCEKFMCKQCLESHQKKSGFIGHEIQLLNEILKNINFVNPSVDDIEEDMRLKVGDIMQQFRATMAKIKENPNGIKNIEEHRARVHAALDKVQEETKQAYDAKEKQINENQESLTKLLKAIEEVELACEERDTGASERS